MIIKLLYKIRAIVRAKYNKTYPPKVPIDQLIRRCEVRMKTSSTFPKCPFCGNLMTFRASNIVLIPNVPIRDDQAYKCINGCWNLASFGIPISKEEAQKEIELRGGSWLQRPTKRLDERDSEEIKRRLRNLGYDFI